MVIYLYWKLNFYIVYNHYPGVSKFTVIINIYMNVKQNTIYNSLQRTIPAISIEFYILHLLID